MHFLLVLFLSSQAPKAPVKKPVLNVMKLLNEAQDGINNGCSSVYLTPQECINVTGIIDASKRDASQDRPKAVILSRILAEEGKLGAYSRERPYLDWLIKVLYNGA